MSEQLQAPPSCSVPGCGHVHELQCALMSIASGGTQRVRHHQVDGRWIRDRNDEVWKQVDGTYTREVDAWPGLWEELQTTIARLHKFGSSSGMPATSAETPVPYHRRASEVAHRLRNEVTTWARAFAGEHPHLTLPADTPPAVARWLATFPGLLAEHEAFREMLAGVRAVVRQAERVIDRAPDLVYAGPCLEPLTEQDEARLAEDPAAVVDRCPGHLYAKVRERDGDGEQQAETSVRCRECGARHVVAERQRWLSSQLGPSLVTAAEAAPVLSWLLDKTIKVDTIHKWRTRAGRLVEHGEYLGRPLYRFDELEALAREVRTRASKPRVGAESTRQP